MNSEVIISELKFKAVRSSGAGGQHVNKVSSKIELIFDLENSLAIADEEKELLLLKLSSRLTNENILLLNCDESRSQHKNKELVIERFLTIIKNALKVPKKRRPTRPTRASVERRIDKKKNTGLKKSLRKKPNI